MGTLARLLVKVAALNDVVDRKANARIVFSAQLQDVDVFIDRVQVRGEDRLRLLKERVLIMPGAQVGRL
jgi:hypothetical protein